MHTYVIALDQGTTSSRAVLFDESARIVAMKSYEFEQIYPQPGWVEHDPAAILNTQVDALREVVRISGVPLDSIAAIGITNQRETTLLWDRKTGRPLHNAIVWQCRRTAPIVARLCEEGLEKHIKSDDGARAGRLFFRKQAELAAGSAWACTSAPSAGKSASARWTAFWRGTSSAGGRM